MGSPFRTFQGGLVFANASAARTIGFPSAEALLAAPPAELMDRFGLFDEEGAPLTADRLPARVVLGGGLKEAALLVRYRVAGGGEDHWSRIRAYPVFDAAGQLVQAINVFQDVTREHRADERRAFLARAIDELSSSLDYHATLASVARLAVPTLADWCAVDVVEGERTQRLAVAHVDPAKIAFVAELERRYPPDPASPTGVPRSSGLASHCSCRPFRASSSWHRPGTTGTSSSSISSSSSHSWPSPSRSAAG